ncbi:MAG: hypothetical protein ACRD3O_06225, partial [Terriglobia bacterium]
MDFIQARRHLITTVIILSVISLTAPGAAAHRSKASRRLADATPRTDRHSTARDLAGIAPTVKQAIRQGDCPGAVVVVGHDGKVVYEKAFGHLLYQPHSPRMKLNTLFDMA